jgi:hypothetical protein
MSSLDAAADPETSPLPEVVADALRYPYTEEEWGAGHVHPYAIPAALRTHRDRIMRELRSRVEAGGDTPWVVTRMLVDQYRLDSRYLDQLARDRFRFDDAACVLVASAALSIDEAREILLSVPTFRGDSLRRQIVVTLRDRGLLDEARAEASRIGEYSWSAHRDIGWRLAVDGRHEEFMRHWRDYAAGTGRDRMTRLKAALVRGVAEKHGWESAVALARKDKRLGAGFTLVALRQAAETMSPDQLIAFLGRDAQGYLTEEDELRLLVEALLRVTPRNPTSEHPLLLQTIDRISAIDPLGDKATMRSRDALLARLWPTIADEETLKRVRKEVRTPMLKRELMVLPRQVVPARKDPTRDDESR